MEQKIHEMTIKPIYFDLVLQGIEKYEVRTNDYRRKAMEIGDLIHMVEESDEKRELMLIITSKTEFPTFAELFDNMPKKDLGYEGRTTESLVEEIREFYSEEKERSTGVVAIGVALVKNKTLEL
jgi:ASC-1-like (ASCH) protein